MSSQQQPRTSSQNTRAGVPAATATNRHLVQKQQQAAASSKHKTAASPTRKTTAAAAAGATAKPQPLQAAGDGASGPGSAERRRMVEAFYRKYAPHQLGRLDDTCNIKCSDERLMLELRKKYVTAETAAAKRPAATATSTATAAPSSGSSGGGGGGGGAPPARSSTPPPPRASQQQQQQPAAAASSQPAVSGAESAAAPVPQKPVASKRTESPGVAAEQVRQERSTSAQRKAAASTPAEKAEHHGHAPKPAAPRSRPVSPPPGLFPPGHPHHDTHHEHHHHTSADGSRRSSATAIHHPDGTAAAASSKGKHHAADAEPSVPLVDAEQVPHQHQHRRSPQPATHHHGPSSAEVQQQQQQQQQQRAAVSTSPPRSAKQPATAAASSAAAPLQSTQPNTSSSSAQPQQPARESHDHSHDDPHHEDHSAVLAGQHDGETGNRYTAAEYTKAIVLLRKRVDKLKGELAQSRSESNTLRAELGKANVGSARYKAQRDDGRRAIEEQKNLIEMLKSAAGVNKNQQQQQSSNAQEQQQQQVSVQVETLKVELVSAQGRMEALQNDNRVLWTKLQHAEQSAAAAAATSGPLGGAHHNTLAPPQQQLQDGSGADADNADEDGDKKNASKFREENRKLRARINTILTNYDTKKAQQQRTLKVAEGEAKQLQEQLAEAAVSRNELRKKCALLATRLVAQTRNAQLDEANELAFCLRLLQEERSSVDGIFDLLQASLPPPPSATRKQQRKANNGEIQSLGSSVTGFTPTQSAADSAADHGAGALLLVGADGDADAGVDQEAYADELLSNGDSGDLLVKYHGVACRVAEALGGMNKERESFSDMAHVFATYIDEVSSALQDATRIAFECAHSRKEQQQQQKEKALRARSLGTTSTVAIGESPVRHGEFVEPSPTPKKRAGGQIPAPSLSSAAGNTGEDHGLNSPEALPNQQEHEDSGDFMGDEDEELMSACEILRGCLRALEEAKERAAPFAATSSVSASAAAAADTSVGGSRATHHPAADYGLRRFASSTQRQLAMLSRRVQRETEAHRHTADSLRDRLAKCDAEFTALLLQSTSTGSASSMSTATDVDRRQTHFLAAVTGVLTPASAGNRRAVSAPGAHLHGGGRPDAQQQQLLIEDNYARAVGGSSSARKATARDGANSNNNNNLSSMSAQFAESLEAEESAIQQRNLQLQQRHARAAATNASSSIQSPPREKDRTKKSLSAKGGSGRAIAPEASPPQHQPAAAAAATPVTSDYSHYSSSYYSTQPGARAGAGGGGSSAGGGGGGGASSYYNPYYASTSALGVGGGTTSGLLNVSGENRSQSRMSLVSPAD